MSVGNFKSTQVRLKAGVPQGSVLSPLLFNLYVNDISLRLDSCKMFQYADDTVLVSSHLDFHHSVRLLQHDIERVMDWFSDNLFMVNADKTKLVCFRNPLKRTTLDTSVALHRSNCRDCECPTLDFVSSVKYLGVFFDSDLSWSTHLSHVCGKLRTVSCFLFNSRIFMPYAVRRSIAHALAFSVLRYGITLFGNCAELWQNKVDRIWKGLLKSVGYQLAFPVDTNIFEV